VRAWLRYVIALIVFCHGFIYFRFGLGGLPEALKDWKGRSLLLGNTVTGDRLRVLSCLLSLVAGLAILLCGVSIAFAGSAHGLWRPLASIGAVVGILFFLVFWDGQTARLVSQGLLGVLVSAVLLLAAILLPRAFG